MHKHIAHAQRHQKKQYDKRSQEVKWQVGDRTMVHMPGTIRGKAWKFAQAFYGPYRVVAVTPTNAEVRLVDKPSEASIFVSLDRLRRCPGELPDVSWVGQYSPKKSRQCKKAAPASGLKSVPSSQTYSGPMTRSRSRVVDALGLC